MNPKYQPGGVLAEVRTVFAFVTGGAITTCMGAPVCLFRSAKRLPSFHINQRASLPTSRYAGENSSRTNTANIKDLLTLLDCF